jgi:ABC-type transporter Mla subunit MlaD
VINSITPRQNPKTGRVVAIISMKLEKSIEPLPVDTKTIVQSRSAVGLKYLELVRGKSSQGIKAGGTIPLSHATEPVQIDQFFNMFDEKTRNASQHNLVNFGNGLAGRGLGLNETIHELRPLVHNALPVLRNLTSPATDLRGFFIGLDRAAKGSAPVAQQNASFWSSLDTFFKAWASVAPSLEATIEGGPPALEQSTHSLRFEASFIEKSTTFMHLLRPASKALRTAAPAFGNAVEAGVTDFRAASALNGRIKNALVSLRSFSEDPVVGVGLGDLTETLQYGYPPIAGLASEQSTCNYLTLTFRNVVSMLSQDVGVGTMARASIVLAPNGPNNEGFPSSGPARGPSVDHPFGSTQVIPNNHLHYNPYPIVAGLGQPKRCEAANEHYLVSKEGEALIGHAPSSANTHDVTERSQDQYGNTYPASTLRDLGLASASTKTKKSRKKK